MKNIRQFEKIRSLLEGVCLYGTSPNKKELLSFLEKAKKKKKYVRLMYGETYDIYGMTIDSLKYYFFVSLFHRLLEEEGLEVSSTIIVGDLASVINDSVKDKAGLLQQAEERRALLQKIIYIFDLPIQPLLMSKLFKDGEIQKVIEKVRAFTKTSSLVQDLFAKTVFEYLVAQEKASGFRYACEETATSLQFDIKFGPPREQFYDKATQIVGPALQLGTVYGIYLQPTYPLGKDFSYFIINKKIEEFGLTPYKAGSNKLQDNRIILSSTNLSRVDELLASSYIPNSFELANPVFDLYFISDLARRFLEKDYSIPEYHTSLLENQTHLRKQTMKFLKEYIFSQVEKKGVNHEQQSPTRT